MAASEAFDHVCEQLEQRSALDRLESRGTVRIALKQAGLDVRSVSPEQMAVVLERVLPRELTARGVGDAEALCRRLVPGLSTLGGGAGADSPDAVFRRLGGGH